MEQANLPQESQGAGEHPAKEEPRPENDEKVEEEDSGHESLASDEEGCIVISRPGGNGQGRLNEPGKEESWQSGLISPDDVAQYRQPLPRTKQGLINRCMDLGLPNHGTVKELRERINQYYRERA
jgi:hypothetical protein